MAMKKTADNLSYIDQIMRRVSECPWSPFKLNEIVTLERCLQEVSAQDPQFNLILRKLATETIFVEPSERLKHQNRSKQDEQSDIEFKRSSLELRGQIDTLSEEVQYYAAKLDELTEAEEAMQMEIFQLNKSIVSIDRSSKLLSDELGLLLLRVYDSFECSLSIIREQIPEYVLTVSQSKLVRQAEEFPVKLRKSLLKLARKNSTGVVPLATVLNFKRMVIKCLNNYLGAQANLYRDLILIQSLYSSDIPVELDQIRAFEEHILHLKRPIVHAPRRVIHSHLDPLDDTGAGQLLDSRAHVLELSDLMADDPELSRMFGLVAKMCKSSSSAAPPNG